MNPMSNTIAICKKIPIPALTEIGRDSNDGIESVMLVQITFSIKSKKPDLIPHAQVMGINSIKLKAATIGRCVSLKRV
jgi:hypothetical protein